MRLMGLVVGLACSIIVMQAAIYLTRPAADHSWPYRLNEALER